jgi:hypothetical protein
MRWPRVPYIIPEDVRSVNRTLKPDQQGRRTVDIFYSDKMAEDQFSIELVPRKQQLQSKANHSGRGPSSSGRKRKRGAKVYSPAPAKNTDSQSDHTNDTDGWRLSKDGKWMLKRDGKQIVRKPIENLEDPATPVSFNDSSRESSLDRLLTTPEEDPPNVDDVTGSGKKEWQDHSLGSSTTCEGPMLAVALRELMETLEKGAPDMPAVVAMAERCCNVCYPASRVVSSVLGDLARIARLLEATSEHTAIHIDSEVV